MNEQHHEFDGDELAARYREASALEGVAPNPALRAAVLAKARALARQSAASAAPQTPKTDFSLQSPQAARRAEAANNRRWLVSATASFAVVALAGLLALQLGRGPSEEQDLALGRTAAPPMPAAPAMPSPAAVAPPPPPPVAAPAPPVVQDAMAPQPAPQPPTASMHENKREKTESRQRASSQRASPAPAKREGFAPMPLADEANKARKSAETQGAPTVAKRSIEAQVRDAAAVQAITHAAPPPPAADEMAPLPDAAAPVRASPAPAKQERYANAQDRDAATAQAIAHAPPPSPAVEMAAQPGVVAPARAMPQAPAAAPAPMMIGGNAPSTSAYTATVPPAQRLLAAAAAGELEAMRQALAAGASPNAADAQGRTALMLAARHSDATLVTLLLQAGADPRRTDTAGLTAAAHARRAGHEGVAQLIEAATVNEKRE